MRGTLWLDHFVKDTGFAVRQLRRAPGFTAVAVLSLALGIGANTAIFTLIESSLLQPIAVKHADKLRLLTWYERVGGWVAPNLGYMSATFGSIYEQGETADGGIKHTDFSPPVYQNFVRNNTVFESLFSFKELGRVTAVADGTAEALRCFSVSGDFYRGLEVAPVIGRAIGPEHDTKTQSASVALISYEYWTRRFARSPAVIGKIVILNEVPVTIIGVNPEYFTGIEPGGNFEVWVPLSLSAAVIGRSFLDETRAWQIPIMGRLKPDVSDARAQGELDALFQAGVDANPGPIEPMLKDPAKRPRFVLESAARGVDYLNEIYGRLLLAVLALAALVLLIACANVANLLLVRSAVRQREISLRLALGAGRGRLARQLLAEGLLLASMAGVAGVVLGYWARNGIPALLATPWRPSPFDAAFDPKVLMLSITVTFVTGILFSLAPVWQSRRVEVNDVLKEDGRGTGSLSKLRAGRLLAVLQVALSVLLLASAGLCVKTFANLRSAPLGFRPEGVMMFTLDPPRLRYPAGSTGPLLAQLRERLGAIPGVHSARFSGSRVGVVVDPDDQTPGENRYASASSVGNRFFETMGIPILFGRPIDDRDIPNGPRAVVVNREFGRRFFKDQNVAGRNIRGSDKALYQIVGVCADWHAHRLRDAVRPAFYTALVQEPRGAGEGEGSFRCASSLKHHRLRTQAREKSAQRPTGNRRANSSNTRLDRFEPGGHRPAHRRRANRGRLGAGAPDGLAGGHLRRAGADPGVRRHLRRHGLLRCAADQRNRHPNGIGRAAGGSGLDGPARDAGFGGSGSCPRDSRGACAEPDPGSCPGTGVEPQLCLRAEARRSAHDRGRRDGTGHRGLRGRLSSGPPGGKGRSDDRSTARLKPGRTPAQAARRETDLEVAADARRGASVPSNPRVGGRLRRSH